MAKLIYPYDPSGVAISNKIVDELRSVQPPTNIDQPSFVIVRAGPFFRNSLEIFTAPNRGGTKLIEGKDFFVTHEFVAGSNFLGKPMAGGVAFTNALYKGNTYFHYQTLGGDFTVNDTVVLEELTRRYYADIRWVKWDQLTGVPSAFPPDAHQHVVTDIKTMADVYYSLEKIAAALVTGGSGTGDDGSKALSLIVAHMSAIQNAHTPEAVGLGNVRNYAMASYEDALANRADRYASPLIVTYMYKKLTEELNPGEMKAEIVQIHKDIDDINKQLATIRSQLQNINLALANMQTSITQIQNSVTQLTNKVNELNDTSHTALTIAQQALGQAAATDANVVALADRTNQILYADNSFLPPGTHRIIIPSNTALRVELIGGGAGSGKWYSLSTDAILTGGGISHGEDSVLWMMGTSKKPVEPIPLLIAGGGKAGLNSYGNIGRSNSGIGGIARRFKGENIYLSSIDPKKINFGVDLVQAGSDNNGLAGTIGDTSNTQVPVAGIGGYSIDASGDGYHQVYGRGCSGNSRAGTGGSGARWSVILRNDTKEDQIFMVRVGKGGQSARANLNDETAFSINDLINTSGIGLLTLVS